MIDAIVFILSANNTLEESRFNIDFNVNLGHKIWVTDNVAYHVIGTSELRVNFHSHRNQASWNGVHQVVLICLETANLAADFFPASLTC